MPSKYVIIVKKQNSFMQEPLICECGDEIEPPVRYLYLT